MLRPKAVMGYLRRMRSMLEGSLMVTAGLI